MMRRITSLMTGIEQWKKYQLTKNLMHKAEKNFFMVNRSLLNSDLWLSEKFTRGQAWIDLLGLANHTDGHIRVRGNRITIKRGQVGYSVEKLRGRWNWSKRKANDWFKELVNDQQIIHHKNYTTSVITIINYEKYQGNAPAASPTDSPTQLPADSPLIKKVKKEKKVNNNTSKEVTDKSDEPKVKKSYGDPEINKMLIGLKGMCNLDDFKESLQVQRNFGKHLVNLKKKILDEEFARRLKIILENEWKVKQINSIKYLYGEIKSTPRGSPLGIKKKTKVTRI